jgi:hypothetical protein
MNDTWSFDAAQGIWFNLHPEKAPPLANTMAYDSRFDRLVLFGGPNQTWTYDHAANLWSNQSSVPSPPGRSGHAMVFAASRGVVVLFGGWVGWSPASDTWTYQYGRLTAPNPGPITPLGDRFLPYAVASLVGLGLGTVAIAAWVRWRNSRNRERGV